MVAEKKLLMSISDGVAIVTFNRPAQRNALDTELIEELRECLSGLSSSPDVGACVLTGAGPAFCAGADLKQRLKMTAGEQVAQLEGIFQCSNLLEQLPVPVIAAVNGPAYAGGLELAVACDIRIAAANAVFCLSEVSLGIFPGAGSPIRLQRLVGRGQAKLMIFSGEPIGADEALRIGLVERTVPGEKLMEEALGLATRIAANSRPGVQAAKLLMNSSGEMSFSAAMALSNSLRHPLSRTKESTEGLERFSRKEQ